MTGEPPDPTGLLDFDIHGLVGIRLIHPTEAAARSVTREFGLMRQILRRAPDIIVRFVDDLPGEPLCFVDRQKNGFTEDSFFILEDATKTRIDFDQNGKQWEIVCGRDARSVPLLKEILNLALLQRDCAPLHASALRHRGQGILLTGWANAGKTTALLAFASLGAGYIGDDRILISGDGQKMYGLPEDAPLPTGIHEPRQHPSRREEMTKHVLCSGIKWLEQISSKLPENGGRTTLPKRAVEKARTMVKTRLNATLARQTILCGGADALQARPEKIFLMVSHTDPRILIERIDPLAVARRMSALFAYEQLPLLRHYLAFQFAFPQRRSELIESAQELHAEILSRALAGKKAYLVRLSHPSSFREVSEALRPYLEDESAQIRPAAEGAVQHPITYAALSRGGSGRM